MNQLIDGREPEEPTTPAEGDDPSAPGTDAGGWFVRAAAFVGDLGDPFYAEERQRDVWNEASAVGLQLLLWLGMAAAPAMVWIGGASAVPYALIVFLLVVLVALVTMEYAKRLGVEVVGAQVGTPARRARLRAVPLIALQAAFWTGIVHARGDLGAHTATGWVVGLAVGAAAGAATALWQRRRARLSAHQADSRAEV